MKIKKFYVGAICLSAMLMVSCGDKSSTPVNDTSDVETVSAANEDDEESGSESESSLQSDDVVSDDVAADDASSSSSDIDGLLDKYEDYVSSYIRLLEKSQKGDMSAMTEYAECLQKAQDLQSEMSSEQSTFTAKQLARYTKITTKMTTALSKMSN